MRERARLLLLLRLPCSCSAALPRSCDAAGARLYSQNASAVGGGEGPGDLEDGGANPLAGARRPRLATTVLEAAVREHERRREAFEQALEWKAQQLRGDAARWEQLYAAWEQRGAAGGQDGGASSSSSSSSSSDSSSSSSSGRAGPSSGEGGDRTTYGWWHKRCETVAEGPMRARMRALIVFLSILN